MIGFALLSISVLFGVSFGLHLHASDADALRGFNWRRVGAALVLGIAAWSASALLDTPASLASIATGHHSWLVLLALVVAVSTSFVGLRVATRYGRARRVAAGLVIGGGIALATWLNLVAGSADAIGPHALSGALLSICGAAVGLALYPVSRIALLQRAAAGTLVTAGCLAGALRMAGAEAQVDLLPAGIRADTFVLLACAYASFLLLLLIERDARREADDLSASLRRANEDLIEFEQRDPVTLLRNRAQFSRRMTAIFEQVTRRHGIAAVAVFGIDGLSLINDAYGAMAADEALRIVAGRLLARVRDDRAGCLGAGELAIVLTRFHDVGELTATVESMLDALSQPILLGDDETVHLSICTGFAVHPYDGEGLMPLTRAIHAMQRAKRSGRKQVCMFDAALDCALERDLRVQSGLHRALANHEFVLHLQPKVDANTSAIVGAEALLRWDSPDGIIAPNEFIGVAERHGLIKDIGWFVIEETCRMARRLRERNIVLPLAVNLAPAQFTDPGLIPRLCETVARYSVSPGSLCLEITESMAMENAEQMAAVLQTLHALGFRIAMDDFGTGHSSLSKLVSLPVDELKLDRSFIIDIETDPRRRSIVQAIIELAHACGCTVVAEGVETRGQATLIADLGAELAQGFHWHRPMPCAALIELIEHKSLRETRLKLISAA
ncbi:MAG TPA: bifunctional diguanylate cyclase/phosphodiesterase [Rhodanobacteraceae bacterium]|nr:bifunctional diguanylate cyclase/phosphodiesterase [Rhodanobacteraceae bacterium]